MKETVEQCVMRVVIEHVERGQRMVPVHLIEAAHPEHQLSGRARIRGLRGRGYLSYTPHDNHYHVLSDLRSLYESWERLTGKPWRDKQVKVEVEETPEARQRMIERMREFRESL